MQTVEIRAGLNALNDKTIKIKNIYILHNNGDQLHKNETKNWAVACLTMEWKNRNIFDLIL